MNKYLAPLFIALALAVTFRFGTGGGGRPTELIETSVSDGHGLTENSDGGLRSTHSAAGEHAAQAIEDRLDFADRMRDLLADRIDPEQNEVSRITLFREWSDVDPVSMTTWVAKHLVGEDRIQAFKQAAVIWAGNDLDAAIRWAEALPDEGERNAILLEVGFEAARLNPSRAVVLAARMPLSRQRDELVVHAVGQWASLDAVAAGDWASRMPESPLRQEVLSAVAVSLSSEDGRYAAGLVADVMVAGKQQSDASILVARNWGSRHPEEAADWITRFPDPSVRQQALRGLVAGWSTRSSEAMLTWVNSLSNSSLREEALTAIASLPKRSLESAEDTLEGIGP